MTLLKRHQSRLSNTCFVLGPKGQLGDAGPSSRTTYIPGPRGDPGFPGLAGSAGQPGTDGFFGIKQLFIFCQ